jgi:MFS family permease
VLGGFVAAVSYRASFLTAAAALFGFALLVLILMHETLPARPAEPAAADGEARRQAQQPAAGYRQIARDTFFLTAVLAFAFNGMGSALPFQMLGVYGTAQLGLGASMLGWIISVNAIMVVLFQVPMANSIRRFNSLKVLASGALFYAAGISSMALATNALQLGVCMAVLTVGELLIAPTFTSLAVNLAPPDMRGRYMSVYWIGWSVSRGVGPAIAGQVYETVSPTSIWYLGAAWNLIAALIFASLAPTFRRRKALRASTG